MSTSRIKIKGLADEKKLPKDFVIRMQVTFGPGFSKGQLTRSEFVATLREQSRRQATGFLKEMFLHYADHVEAAAAHFPKSKYAPSERAPMTLLNTYYGCGSCDDCSVSHPGGDCAICIHDDVQSCEPCG